MAWKFKNDIPIYLQIMERVKSDIARGNLKAGDKLPGVRDLALEAGVNPNTMQKALSLLEVEGIVYSKRTSGRYISEVDKDIQKNIKEEHTRQYVVSMRQLGLNDNQIKSCLDEYLSRKFN